MKYTSQKAHFATYENGETPLIAIRSFNTTYKVGDIRDTTSSGEASGNAKKDLNRVPVVGETFYTTAGKQVTTFKITEVGGLQDPNDPETVEYKAEVVQVSSIAGMDGNRIEYVYYRSQNELKDLSAPSYTGTTLTEGWTASPQGITELYKYEYMSVRTKDAGSDTWSSFSPPVIWSKWGERGQDGDGIEYKYCLTNSTVKPLYPAPADASYVWTDEPSGVSAENRYEYVVSIVVSPIESTAKKINTEIRNFPLEGENSWSFYGEKGHEENWTIRGTGNLDNSHIYLGDYAYVEGFVQGTETPVKLYGKVIELYNSSAQQGHIKMRSSHLVIGDYKTPTSTVSLWSNYSTSPYLISFDNDSATIGATKDGTVDTTVLQQVSKVTTTVYLGQTDITSDCTFSWVPSGGTLYGQSMKWNYFTEMTKDTATVTVTVKYNGTTIGTKTFTISKSIAGQTGDTGDAAVSYKLSVSPNSWNNTVGAGTDVTFTVTKFIGNNEPEQITSGFKIKDLSGTEYSGGANIGDTTTFVLIVDGTEVDYETVTAVRNGDPGAPGAPGAPGTPGAPGAPGTPGIRGAKTESIRVYLINNSATANKPTVTTDGKTLQGGWSETEPTEPNGLSGTNKYMWSCTGTKTTTYSNATGTTGETKYNSDWTTPELYKAFIQNVDPFAAAEYYKLTNFGKEQGIEYGSDGKLYINATYIKSGTTDADLILAGKIVASDIEITGGKIGNLTIEGVETISATATEAKNTANTANATANTANTTANTASATASAASGKADEASGKADIASGKADEAKDAATKASGKADIASGKADEAKQLAIAATNTSGTYSWNFSPSNGIFMYNGSQNTNNLVFSVGEGGLYVKGTVHAGAGSVAGWEITKDCLSSEHTRFFGANRYRKKTYNNSYSPLRMMSSSGYLQKKTGSYSISINGNTENTQRVQPVTSSNQIIYCEIKSVPNGIELKDFYVNDNLLYCTIKNTTSSKITGTIEYYIEYLTSPSFYVLDDGFLRASSIQLGSGNLGSPDTAFLATTNLTGPNTFFPDENSQGRGNWRLAVGSHFGVTSDGSLYASNANISGTISASGGNIAGWDIDDGMLVNYGTENENILQGVFLFQNKDIQDNTYALVIGNCLKEENEIQWSDAGFKVGFSGNVYVKTMAIGYENDRYSGWSFSPDEIGWGSGWIRWEKGNITCNTISMTRAAVTTSYTDCDITNKGQTTGFKIRDNYSEQKAYFKIIFSPGIVGTSIYMYYCDSSYNEIRPASNCSTKLFIYSRRKGQGKDEGVMKEWNPSFSTSGGTATKTYYYDEFNCWIGADYLGYGFTETAAIEMSMSEEKKIDSSITDYITGTVIPDQGIFGINVSYTHLAPSSKGGRLLTLGTSGNPWYKAYLTETSHVSDRKLKKEILTIPDTFSKKFILGLQPKSYKFVKAETPRTKFGFIAQEVEDLLISLGTSADEIGIVNKSKPEEPDNEDNRYSLNYTCLLAPMVSMIQQQEKRISELETEIQNLKSV